MTSLCVEVVGLFIYQVLLSTHTVNDGNRDHWGCINVHISSPLPTGPDQPGRLRQIFRNHTRAQVSHQHDKALNISYLKYLNKKWSQHVCFTWCRSSFIDTYFKDSHSALKRRVYKLHTKVKDKRRENRQVYLLIMCVLSVFVAYTMVLAAS